MPTPRRGLGGKDPLLAGRRRLPSLIQNTTAVEEVDLAETPAQSVTATAVPPPADAELAHTEPAHTVTAAPAKRTKVIAKDKTQVTSYLPTAVVNDARDAVLALMANPAGHRTLSGLIEEGVRREIARLRETYNDGQPFPPRQVELQPGRPSGR